MPVGRAVVDYRSVGGVQPVIPAGVEHHRIRFGRARIVRVHPRERVAVYGGAGRGHVESVERESHVQRDRDRVAILICDIHPHGDRRAVLCIDGRTLVRGGLYRERISRPRVHLHLDTAVHGWIRGVVGSYRLKASCFQDERICTFISPIRRRKSEICGDRTLRISSSESNLPIILRAQVVPRVIDFHKAAESVTSGYIHGEARENQIVRRSAMEVEGAEVLGLASRGDHRGRVFPLLSAAYENEQLVASGHIVLDGYREVPVCVCYVGVEESGGGVPHSDYHTAGISAGYVDDVPIDHIRRRGRGIRRRDQVPGSGRCGRGGAGGPVHVPIAVIVCRPVADYVKCPVVHAIRR